MLREKSNTSCTIFRYTIYCWGFISFANIFAAYMQTILRPKNTTHFYYLALISAIPLNICSIYADNIVNEFVCRQHKDCVKVRPVHHVAW